MAGVRHGNVAFNLVQNSDREWAENTSAGIGVVDLEAVCAEYRGVAAKVWSSRNEGWGVRQRIRADDEGRGAMTRRLYRIILVTTALAWLQAGMRLDHAASILDAGGTPEPGECLALVLLAIVGFDGVVALWRHPVVGPRVP
jgi:hypothetical protein